MVVAAGELRDRWPGRLMEPPDLRVGHCWLAGESWLPLILALYCINSVSDGNQSSDDSKMR